MSITAFKEVQRFSSLPLLLMLAIVAVILIRVFFSIIASRHNKKTWLLFPVFFIPAGVLVLTLSMRLETRLDSSGIYYRFYPVHTSERKIAWEEVDTAYIRTYNPIVEYGGWGIRTGRSGKAYNTSGSQGLQIVFKNGNKLLLGTQKPAEMSVVVAGLFPENSLHH